MLTSLGFLLGFIMLMSSRCMADLPIHATISDVSNPQNSQEFWRFFLSPPRKEHQLCGAGTPNTNLAMQKPELANYRQWLLGHNGGIESVIDVVLTDTAMAPPLSSFDVSITRINSVDSPYYKLYSHFLNHSHRKQWLSLGVLDAASRQKVVGGWTMVYDQGFEIYVKDPTFERYSERHQQPVGKNGSTSHIKDNPLVKRLNETQFLVLFALLKYQLKNDQTSSTLDEVCHFHVPNNDDAETADGETTCYTTDPGETSMGWFYISSSEHSHKGDNRLYGCFAGQKMNRVTSHKGIEPDFLPSMIEMTRLYHPSNTRPTRALHGYLKVGALSRTKMKRFTRGLTSLNKLSKRNPTRRSSSEGFACDVNHTLRLFPHNEFSSTLPVNFSSVMNPFVSENDRQRLSPRRIPDVTTQGECGSCYSIASAYVLDERIQLILDNYRNHMEEMFKRSSVSGVPKNYTSELSVQSILSCSFFNQGCSGGYPFLVGKWANEIGIPSVSCMKYRETDEEKCSLEFNDFHPNAANQSCRPGYRAFAKSYGYVGGCYECCSEEAMREEIYFSGPIVAAFHASEDLVTLTDDILDDEANHTRFCDTPGKNLNGWEYTNHAVVIVGWGEELDSSTQNFKKYWIVRNSWGSGWGKEGYFKIARGKNLLGIENQAVFIDPDMSRGYPFQALSSLVSNNQKLWNRIMKVPIHHHHHIKEIQD